MIQTILKTIANVLWGMLVFVFAKRHSDSFSVPSDGMKVTFHESISEKVYNELISDTYQGGQYSDSGVLLSRMDAAYAGVYLQGKHHKKEIKSFCMIKAGCIISVGHIQTKDIHRKNYYYRIISIESHHPVTPKTDHAPVYIAPTGVYNRLMGPKVGLEHIGFENQYDVYCVSDIDARMVTTPSIMESMPSVWSQKVMKSLICDFASENKYQIRSTHIFPTTKSDYQDSARKNRMYIFWGWWIR